MNNYKYKNQFKYNQSIKGICARTMGSIKMRLKRKKEVPFNLDKEYLISIFPKDWICPILKIKMKPNMGSNNVSRFSPSLDKIDPLKGYIKGNVRFVSLVANMMKLDATESELNDLLKHIQNIKIGE